MHIFLIYIKDNYITVNPIITDLKGPGKSLLYPESFMYAKFLHAQNTTTAHHLLMSHLSRYTCGVDYYIVQCTCSNGNPTLPDCLKYRRPVVIVTTYLRLTSPARHSPCRRSLYVHYSWKTTANSGSGDQSRKICFIWNSIICKPTISYAFSACS